MISNNAFQLDCYGHASVIYNILSQKPCLGYQDSYTYGFNFSSWRKQRKAVSFLSLTLCLVDKWHLCRFFLLYYIDSRESLISVFLWVERLDFKAWKVRRILYNTKIWFVNVIYTFRYWYSLTKNTFPKVKNYGVCGQFPMS